MVKERQLTRWKLARIHVLFSGSFSNTELYKRYLFQIYSNIIGLILGVAGQSLGVVKLLSLLSLVMTSLTLLLLNAIANNNYKYYYFIYAGKKHWLEQWLLYSGD